MKSACLALALAGYAGSALAGGYEAPVMESEVIIEETAASSGGDDWVVILMTLVVFGAALSN